MKSGRVQTLLHVIYPSRCMGCGVLVEGDFGLCGSCWRETPFITGLSCDSCGVPLLGGEVGEIAHCDACLSAPRPWEKGRSVLVYEGMARQLVLRLKHGDRTDMVRPAVGWMAGKARELATSESVLVPVPLHWRRFLRRKYNQASLLSEGLAKELGATHCPDALLRNSATAPMKGTREERLEAMQTAIALNPRRKEEITGRSVLLVDDVMTSGATLEACAAAISSANPSHINVITLARVALDL